MRLKLVDYWFIHSLLQDQIMSPVISYIFYLFFIRKLRDQHLWLDGITTWAANLIIMIIMVVITMIKPAEATTWSNTC